MYCPECGTPNPTGAERCAKCTTVLPRSAVPASSRDTLAADADSTLATASTPLTGPGAFGAGSVVLCPGSVLGKRYEILAVLGQGGMGAVYKVRDRAVGGYAALKVIRPEMANHPEVLQRFKQELVLARQVTHKNVIRIHDFGEADGVKFITMDFVEGRDLASLIRERGKLPSEEAVPIIAQVCRALEAAHAEGVVHRDLKPQNIMLDTQGRVKVMDFGIARSTESGGGMTQTGALIGTPEYMSPEQAKGQEVDTRSDLFSLGIIFYELLTGKTPFHAETAMGMIYRRTQESARPPIDLDPTIPQSTSDAVLKCLERNREERFQTASAVLIALGQEAAAGTGVRPSLSSLGVSPMGTDTIEASNATTLPGTAVPVTPPAAAPSRSRKWLYAGAAAAVMVLAAAVFLLRGRLFPGGSNSATPAGRPLTLAILPFRNASGDASLDWLGSSLAEILRTDVGESEGFRTVSPDRLHEVVAALGISPDTQVDSDLVHRVAGFTDADLVLDGQYVKFGNQIRIDARLEDLVHQRTIPLKVEAKNQDALLASVDELAKSIQHDLSLAPSAIRQMRASAFAPSSKSVAALKAYTLGLSLLRQGNPLDAVKQFQAATTADSNFALGYSMLGRAYYQLGHDQQAQQYSGQAVDLSSGLPDTEKYMIAASNAQIAGNHDRAIAAYHQLAGLLPNDTQVQYSLGRLYEDHGNLTEALKHYDRVVTADPKDLESLLAVGRVQIKSDNAQASLDPLNRALSMAVELNDRQGKARILQALGIAYQVLGRPQDALSNFQQSLVIKQQIGDQRGIAASLDQIAQVDETLGKPADAVRNYQQEMKITQQIGDQSGLARALNNYADLQQAQGSYTEALDATKKALQIYTDLSDNADQAIAENNIGNMYFYQSRYTEALTFFQQALSLRQKMNDPSNVAMVTNNIGQIYAKLGQYDRALAQYFSALDAARKASDKFEIANAQTSMAGLFQIQGRYGASLNSAQQAYQSFQQMGMKNEFAVTAEIRYGLALALVGRSDQAAKPLNEALASARSLGYQWLVAKTLDDQGVNAFYAGNFPAATSLFSQAAAFAGRLGAQGLSVAAKIGQARVQIRTGHAAAAAASLRQLAGQADSIGAKYLSTECTLYLGEALVASRNYAQAQAPVGQALRAAQNGGMQSLLPAAEYLMGEAYRGAGQAGMAGIHFKKAAKYLREMRQESKSQSLLRRADLQPIAQAVGVKSE